LSFTATPAQTSLHLDQSRAKQIRTLENVMSKLNYGAIIRLRDQIDAFRGLVHGMEQPFKHVQTLVRHARLNQRTAEDFTFDKSVVLQTRSYSWTTSLLIRCDLAILSDALTVRSSQPLLPVDVAPTVNLTNNRIDCDALFKISDEGKHSATSQDLVSQRVWTPENRRKNHASFIKHLARIHSCS
jgi:hypothetical protein